MKMPGYVQFGGNTVVDEARTREYLLDFGAGWTLGDCACPDLVNPPYISPAGDPAPWFEASRPESGDFFGVLLTDVNPSRPVSRTVKPVGMGSLIGPEQLAGVNVTFTGVLTARTAEGMWWGRRWLTDVLRTPCADCSLSDLCLLPVCPPANLSPAQAARYYRTLYDAALVDGPVFGEASSEWFVQPVQWTMSSRSPWWNADEVTVATVSPTTALATITPVTSLEWVEKAALRLVVDGGTGTSTNLRVVVEPTSQCGNVYTSTTALWRASSYPGSGVWNDDNATPFVATATGTPLYCPWDGEDYVQFEATASGAQSVIRSDSPLFPGGYGQGFVIDVKMRPDSWSNPTTFGGIPPNIAGRWVTGNLAQSSFRLRQVPSGIEGQVTDGTNVYTVRAQSPILDGETGWVRFRVDPGEEPGSLAAISIQFSSKAWFDRSPFFGPGSTVKEGVDFFTSATTFLGASITIPNTGTPFTVGSENAAAAGPYGGRIFEVRGGPTFTGGGSPMPFINWGFIVSDQQEPFASFSGIGFFPTTWSVIGRALQQQTLTVVDRPCFFLDGAADHFDVPDDPAFDFALADAGTVMCAFRRYDSGGDVTLVSKRATVGVTTGWSLRAETTDGIVAGIGDGTNSTRDTEPELPQQYAQVAAWVRNRAADNLRAYRDLTSTAATNDNLTGTAANANVMRFGAMTGGAGRFRGQLFAIAVWRRVLTPVELKEAASALLGGTTPVTAGCSVFTIDTLAAHEELVVDASRRTITVKDLRSGEETPGLPRLTFDGPFPWPVLSSCASACVQVDGLAGKIAPGVSVKVQTIAQDLL